LTRFLRGEGLLTDSHSLLASVVAFGNVVRGHGPLPDPSARVMAGHCLMAVTLAALEDAGRLDEIPVRELQERLTRALTVGDPDDTHLLPLLERADDFVRYFVDRTHRAYVDAGADPQRIPLPSLKDTLANPPAFLDDSVDFVVRLRSNPQVARSPAAKWPHRSLFLHPSCVKFLTRVSRTGEQRPTLLSRSLLRRMS
jgi:hypothetical protein